MWKEKAEHPTNGGERKQEKHHWEKQQWKETIIKSNRKGKYRSKNNSEAITSRKGE